MEKPITMIEIFSGIGAQVKALNQLPISHEVVATMEIDKDAILSYASMRYDLDKEIQTYNFPSKEEMVSELQRKNVGFDFQIGKHTITMKTNINKIKQYYVADKLSKNLGDVSLQKELPYADIICHTSPCQDYSCAGKGAGGDEGSGTRSSLMFESLRLIETSMPKYVLWENVAAVLSDKHRHNFIKYLEKLSELGYESIFNLCNAKNFGTPQSRLRIFCVSRKINSDCNSIRNIDDILTNSNKQVEKTMREIKNNPNIKIWTDFTFPETIPLTTRLKDVLEKNVDEKYYLPDERIEKILSSTFTQEKKRIQTTDVYDVCEPQVVIGSMQANSYIGDGTISPSLTAAMGMGGGQIPMVGYIKPIIYDDYNSRISADQDAINTLTCNCGASAERNGVKIIEPVVVDAIYSNRPARIYDEAAPTLRSERFGLEVIEPKDLPCSTRGSQVASTIRASIYKQGARNLEQNVINGLGYEGVIESGEPRIRWRIRKLTPKECWRLMGFTDKDAGRSAQFVSASAQYKQAGNSICTSCLVALFSSLLLEDGHKADIWSKYLIHYFDKN